MWRGEYSTPFPLRINSKFIRIYMHLPKVMARANDVRSPCRIPSSNCCVVSHKWLLLPSSVATSVSSSVFVSVVVDEKHRWSERGDEEDVEEKELEVFNGRQKRDDDDNSLDDDVCNGYVDGYTRLAVDKVR